HPRPSALACPLDRDEWFRSKNSRKSSRLWIFRNTRGDTRCSFSRSIFRYEKLQLALVDEFFPRQWLSTSRLSGFANEPSANLARQSAASARSFSSRHC